MSIDYKVYIKDISMFSIRQCEEYFLLIGVPAQIHPDFNILTHRGFLPFKICGDIISEVKTSKELLSGFEVSLDEYMNLHTEGKLLALWKKIFRTPLENAITDSAHVFSIYCGSQNPLEILLANAFAAYLCKYCGGIFVDQQPGRFFTNASLIEHEINVILEQLRVEFRDVVLIQEFDEWH